MKKFNKNKYINKVHIFIIKGGKSDLQTAEERPDFPVELQSV